LTTVATVPAALRRWFVAHFVVDVLIAAPLLVIPEPFLRGLGWTTVDPVSARLVAAGLFGIGVESFLGRNGGVEAYRAMLRLKCIWSGGALLALVIAAAQGGPPVIWVFAAIFAVFGVVWNTFRLRLRA
jgi:hypothetical protein